METGALERWLASSKAHKIAFPAHITLTLLSGEVRSSRCSRVLCNCLQRELPDVDRMEGSKECFIFNDFQRSAHRHHSLHHPFLLSARAPSLHPSLPPVEERLNQRDLSSDRQGAVTKNSYAVSPKSPLHARNIDNADFQRPWEERRSTTHIFPLTLLE